MLQRLQPSSGPLGWPARKLSCSCARQATTFWPATTFTVVSFERIRAVDRHSGGASSLRRIAGCCLARATTVFLNLAVVTGTNRMLRKIGSRLGLEFDFYPTADPEAFAAQIKPNTKVGRISW